MNDQLYLIEWFEIDFVFLKTLNDEWDFVIEQLIISISIYSIISNNFVKIKNKTKKLIDYDSCSTNKQKSRQNQHKFP